MAHERRASAPLVPRDEPAFEHPEPSERAMCPKVNEDERPTEDDLCREKLGPRGIPGQPDTAKMTPQQKKNMPAVGDFDGHTA